MNSSQKKVAWSLTFSSSTNETVALDSAVLRDVIHDQVVGCFHTPRIFSRLFDYEQSVYYGHLKHGPKAQQTSLRNITKKIEPTKPYKKHA